MKRLENGTIYTVEIFNHIDETKSTTLRQIIFESTLLGLTTKFIKNNNPQGQEFILESAKKEENINTFVQLYFQQIMREMTGWSSTLPNIQDIFKRAFNMYLKHFFTEEQLKTIELDNTAELKRVKSVGMTIINDLFLNKQYKFSEIYFSEKDKERRSWSRIPVKFKDFSISTNEEEILGEGQKYKYMFFDGHVIIDSKKKNFNISVHRENDNEYIFKFHVTGYNKRFYCVLTFNLTTKNVDINIKEGRGQNKRKYTYCTSVSKFDATDIFLKTEIMENMQTNTQKITNLSNIF